MGTGLQPGAPHLYWLCLPATSAVTDRDTEAGAGAAELGPEWGCWPHACFEAGTVAGGRLSDWGRHRNRLMPRHLARREAQEEEGLTDLLCV